MWWRPSLGLVGGLHSGEAEIGEPGGWWGGVVAILLAGIFDTDYGLGRFFGCDWFMSIFIFFIFLFFYFYN